MDTFRENIKEELSKLTDQKKILFAALTCEKLYPNYVYFKNITNWGNPEIIEGSIVSIYQYLFGEILLEKGTIQKMIEQVDSIIPDTENFSSIEVSFALDATTAVYSCLVFLIDRNIDNIADIASYARDTVDMFIQEKGNLDPNDPLLEAKIKFDGFMIREIDRQNDLIRRIASLKNITKEAVETLKDNKPIIDVALISRSS